MEPGRLKSLLPIPLLVAATLAVHGNGLGNGFAWDDKFIVVDNPDTRDLSQLGKVVLSPDVMKPYFRPLNRATYLLDFQVAGMDARWFHAVNLLAHLACVLLLYAVGRRLFDSAVPATLAALLLAVHPVHVESVAFVSARNNLLALAFSLAATLLLMRAMETGRWTLAAGSGLAFFLGLASKEQAAMTLPFLAAWLLLAPEARARRAQGLPLLAPHLVALVAYLAIRSVALGGPAATGGVVAGIGERLARNYYILPAYLGLVLIPDRLSIHHPMPDGYLALWWLPLAWLAIGAALVALLRRPTRASTFGLLWLGLNLVPILGFVPIPSTAHTLMAERFIHFSAVGLWIVVADLLQRLARGAWQRPAWTAAALVLFALGARSFVRNRDWKDDFALFGSAVRANPRSLLARFDYGVELKDRGDLDGARRQWEVALSIAPDDPGTHAQLGTLAAVQGRLEEAEAHYRKALRGDPALAEASLNLAKICERTGRPEEAVRRYRDVLGVRPPGSPEILAQARAGLARLGAGSAP